MADSEQVLDPQWGEAAGMNGRYSDAKSNDFCCRVAAVRGGRLGAVTRHTQLLAKYLHGQSSSL